MTTDLHKPDPVPRPRRLARKRDVDELSQLTSGTLTVTVAPDPTCGFTNNDEAVWVCPGGRPCTWEKGQINRFWCAWQQIYTTCLDSTAIFDPAICNSECRTNTRNAIAGCPSSEKPFCVTLELGNGIFSYGCNTISVDERFEFDSTSFRQSRNFSTVVFVDGVSETQWITDGPAPSKMETTPTQSGSSMTASATVEASSSSTQISTSATSIPGDSPNVGAIVGGVVGGLGVIGLVALGLFGLILLRRRRGNMVAPSEHTPGLAQQPHSPSKVTSNTQFVETQAGAYDVSTHSYAAPVQSNGPTPQLSPSTSSPLNKAPSPGTLYNYELDEARTDHHRGSMYEM
ncbi:hypothetical protein NW756_004649 [Fusarium oxysporum]|nr:hypothetical protein NW763_011189 [Fusarium oxysporum]KAJ4065374.1 hypothetical protein NW753_003808 [Fusarium oxysporum]KAJ4095829.1 hypothetical protein NW756_004649 [Fusarium oxysporum]